MERKPVLNGAKLVLAVALVAWSTGTARAQSKPVILDVDPGIDDALAILLALRSPELDVRGVTVVAGNVEVDLRLVNALKMLELAGRADIPVARGAEAPFLGKPLTAKHVHGANGIGNVELPPPQALPYEGSAADLIAEILETRAEPVTLIPVGPLTNIAFFLKTHPELTGRIGELVIMGGTASEGTVAPTISFNILTDPEAAAVVFDSGLPIVMVGFDVTRHVILTPEDVALIATGSDPVQQFVQGVLSFHRESRGAEGVVMHDALAVGVAIDRSFVRTEPAHVQVETRDEHTRGQTVVDTRDHRLRIVERENERVFVRENQPPGTTLHSFEVDVDRFEDFFLRRVLAPTGGRLQ